MRATSPLSPHALLPLCLLGLMACNTGEEPGGPLVPISDKKDGRALRYDTDGTGNCNFDASPEDLKVAALNTNEYAQSAMCGACAEVEGPKGKVRVRIVDLCPGCAPDQLALSPQAFDTVASGGTLEAPVSWRFIACGVEGPVRYRVKEGSNQYWTALQVRNHRLPVQKLEWQKAGTWVTLQRENYNYFVEPSGMGEGSVRVRVTASDGQVLEDTLPYILEGLVVDGAAQFAAD